MIQAYKEGKDLYCVIAAAMFNNNYEENLEFYPEGTEIELDGKKIICGKKTHLHKAGKERRAAAKTMLLAILYGMSPATAGQRMNKTKEEGKALMDNFFRSFPLVKVLMDESKAFLKKYGYVSDWAGRRRRLPNINLKPYEARYKDESITTSQTFNPIIGCKNREVIDKTLQRWLIEAGKARGNKAFDKVARAAFMETPDNPYSVILTANTGLIAKAERECLNARIQGGAASLTKLAMVNIFNDKIMNDAQAKLIITVHDEVLVECPEFYAAIVEDRLPQVMVDTAVNNPIKSISIPMKCDPYNVTRWYCDEAAVSIQNEFKALETGDSSNGIAPLPREEALRAVFKKHPELPEYAIVNTIEKGIDLDF